MMFLVMGGMVRTGAVEAVVGLVTRHAGDRPKTTVVVLIGSIAVASAFMNNTPLVAVMIPVVMQLAIRIGLAPSKLLIPLSYMTVLGGMITLIGTSTNILVDGVAAKQGLEHFGLFEIAPLGIAVMLAGGVFLVLFGNRLLPTRQSMGVLLNDRRKMKFFTEVAVPEDSTLIGQPVLDIDLFKRDGVRVIDVLRGDASLRRDLAPVTLQAGDRVVLRTEMTELMGLHARKDVHLVDKLSSVKTETVEVLIGPGCRMEGNRLGDLRLRRRYGVYVLAVHRHNQNIGRQLDDLIVRVGDTLLLEGAVEDIQRLAADMDLVDVNRPRVMAFRRAKGADRAGGAGDDRDPVGAGSGADPAPGPDRGGGDPDHPLRRQRRGFQLRRRTADGDDLCHAGGGRGAGPVRCGGHDREWCGPLAGGFEPVLPDPCGLLPRSRADRVPVEQCGGGDLHAGRDPAGREAGPRSAALRGGGDVFRHARLCDAGGLPDQHDGLRAGGLSLLGLHQGGAAAEHHRHAGELRADPADLAAVGRYRRACPSVPAGCRGRHHRNGTGVWAMAGHSKWANIQHRKGKQDKLRSKMFSKLSKEITVAAKMGMPDPDMNPRLRLAIKAAKALSMPKDVIDRAIKKARWATGRITRKSAMKAMA
jgi:uncharacterized protein with PhoU and TrkA domain